MIRTATASVSSMAVFRVFTREKWGWCPNFPPCRTSASVWRAEGHTKDSSVGFRDGYLVLVVTVANAVPLTKHSIVSSTVRWGKAFVFDTFRQIRHGNGRFLFRREREGLLRSYYHRPWVWLEAVVVSWRFFWDTLGIQAGERSFRIIKKRYIASLIIQNVSCNIFFLFRSNGPKRPYCLDHVIIHVFTLI